MIRGLGDKREPSGHTITVASVRHYTADLTAYNLDVTGIHTYYVQTGHTAILVHNSCGSTDPAHIATTADVSTARSQAFFWHGVDESAAARTAHSMGGETLESLTRSRGINMPGRNTHH